MAKSKGRKLPKILESDEISALLNTFNRKCPTGARNYALVAIMWRCGLRVSEALALKPRDLHLDQFFIEVIDGKGGKDRIVPIEEKAIAALLPWMAIRPKNAKTVFCTLKGGPLNRRYVNQFLDRKSDQAQIKHTHAHMLRHTYATELLSEGTYNIRELQVALGHEDISTTQIYAYVRPSELIRKARGRVN